MQNEKDTWIDEVMESMEGSERARPGEDLFSRIERQLDEGSTLDFRKGQWRMLAAAAILLLILNVFVVLQFSQDTRSRSQEVTAENGVSHSLVSDYNLYES